ncbi:SMP-30/gluconolactonase/LRE family protein [Rhizobium sp. 18055]|uniref:SMP-30/gluconolactonase/LRE family protein n=1 Tax=Rhizobium sp. 18055 TaxID=2681403 RepID=UPI001357565D|nr:SMP-30/gluconolactonase/LRE family protein [Rhizobium sp. 18055]
MNDSDFEVLDARAGDCFLSNVYRLERIATGMRWAEGPVWFADRRCLMWSDVPSDRMHYWTEDGNIGIFREPSNHSNGNTRDVQGRLVTCEHATRRVTRTEHSGSVTVLADRFEGKRLNSPNDVVVKSDGSIWFTDPDYGIMTDYEGGRAESEIGACNIYRVDDDSGKISCVASCHMRPNGLAFSADESRLFVADSGGSHNPEGPRKILVHTVENGKTLGQPRLFADLGSNVPDGFRLDDHGNLWTSAGKAVEVYAPDGTLIGRIRTAENVSNLTFGGRQRNRLFITATTSIYAVYTAARGIQIP